MVVGIRQTKRATSTGIVKSTEEAIPKAFSDIIAIKKIKVSAERRIVRAISFGVFCRDAPSTSVIMRSRKVSPGFEVIWILMMSDSTLVPGETFLDRMIT